jgi:uncharacterized protein (DUF1330 family)
VARRGAEELEALVATLDGQGAGGINPDAEHLRALVRANRDGPLQFVNLLAYYDVARYPEGHELAGSGLTGAEAYALYGAVAMDHVARRGGRLTLYNEVAQTLIGDTEWHQVAIMEYPRTEAFVDMILDPEYEAGLVHRDAGLAETLVLVSRALLPPDAP